MAAESLLYLELLFTGFIILAVLYINAIFLYKQKLTDRVSMMLLFAVVMSLSEIVKNQSDALPPVAPEFAAYPDLNLRGSMTTAREVGGDFYDYFPIDENRLCFLIADVSGKGTPAALFLMTSP